MPDEPDEKISSGDRMLRWESGGSNLFWSPGTGGMKGGAEREALLLEVAISGSTVLRGGW
jgi:hypothetical protein